MVVTDTDWEDFDDLDNFGISICTSSTRPTEYEGRHIYETDTNKTMRYTGAAWVELAGGGGDFYADGSVPMTGDLTFNMVDPEIIFDTGDYLQYDKTDNYLHVVIGSAIIASFKNDRIIHNYINYHNANIDMNTYKIVDLGAGTTNGDALRYEQIADASFINLLKNGDFESWSAGASSVPDKWDITGTGAAISKESTEIFSGVNSAKCIYGSSTLFLRNSDRADPKLYLQHRGKYIIVGCMVKTSTASIAAISIGTDAVSTKSAYHSGSGSWELLTATHLLPVDATDLTLKLRVEGAGVVYFDAVVLVEGSICPVFSPKPLVDDGKSIQIDSTTNSVTIGRDPTSDTEAATKKYVDDNAGVGDFLADGTVPMTGNLSMGANNVYLDSGILRMSDGTTLSGSIGFTTGVQNYIQRQLISGSDYTLLSDQDYMHTWAILGTEKMHLSTADGLKLFTKINMNGLKIEGILDPTANQEAATKKYVDDTTGVTDHSLLSNLTWSTAGHSINTTVDMNNNNITDINELWFNTSDPGIKFDTGDFIWFDTSENRTYFEIASTNICYVKSTGIHPNTDSTYYLGSGSAYWKGLYADDVVVEAGTYMTGDASGNMELHVATGKTVKIVVG